MSFSVLKLGPRSNNVMCCYKYLFKHLTISTTSCHKTINNFSNLLNSRLIATSACLQHIKNDDTPLYIFDRNTKFLQRERAASAKDVNVYDYVKDEVGYRLADRIYDIKRKFKLAADIGCSRGYVAKHIAPESVEELILCDSSQNNLDQVQVADGIKVRRKILDEEYIKFEENTLDLVVSSLSLHWVNNLPAAFSNILKSLKEDGVFMASVFGGDTLYELRSSLQLAELERRGGLASHVSPFTEVRDIGSLLTRAGFTMLTIDTDEIVVSYPSMFELMWDLKGMAESNAAHNRSSHLHRDIQFAAAAIYQQLYGKINDDTGEKSVPATFQIINMLGWKPHSAQPKPLERGTGEVSLKDLYRIDEIVKEIKTVKTNDNDNGNEKK